MFLETLHQPLTIDKGNQLFFFKKKPETKIQKPEVKTPVNPTPAQAKTSDKTFRDLGLTDVIVRAVEAQGYTKPTPIQAQAIGPILKGKDIIGCAQTGTGKTAAFTLPILQLLDQAKGDHPKQERMKVQALVLTPTRELAIQIGESVSTYGKYTQIKHATIFGGVGQRPQEEALRRSPHILVATPGRLLDLMNQRFVDLSELKIFVLDEADRMLDMGFIHDVKRVIKAIPRKRQTLFFSATMPREIQDLAASILTDPEKVSVAPVSSTAVTVRQEVYKVDRGNKRHLLVHVLQDPAMTRVLVFTRTKHGANKITEHLMQNKIRSEAIHGNKSQTARQRALSNFKSGKTRVLVASDLAARGLDVEVITHVINFDVPNIPETYVHRIGRTGRAEAQGIAMSFCESEERSFLRDIERLTKQTIPVIEDHPFVSTAASSSSEPKRLSTGGAGPGRNQRRSRGRRRPRRN